MTEYVKVNGNVDTMENLSLTVYSQKDKTDYQIDIIENYENANYYLHVVAQDEDNKSIYEFPESTWDFKTLKEVYCFLKQIEKHGL